MDYLFRVSLKALIRNEAGEVLVMKETGDKHWDLPGGGMDHGETFELAMKRELYEEVSYKDRFDMRLLCAEDAGVLADRAVETWQLRLIYVVKTEHMNFAAGHDADDMKFIHPDTFKDSTTRSERLIYKYCRHAAKRNLEITSYET